MSFTSAVDQPFPEEKQYLFSFRDVDLYTHDFTYNLASNSITLFFSWNRMGGRYVQC